MAILFEQDAEDGVVDAAVAQAVWDPTESGNYPLNIMHYKNATPVPGSGRSKYFQIDVDGDNGTSTSVGTLTLTDTSKNWSAGRWNPQVDKDWNLIDSAGTVFNIASHTSDTITVRSGLGNPAAGAYRICGQHDSWNQRHLTQINLTPGTEYFYGFQVRFEKINDLDIWWEQAVANDDYSSSKLGEINGNLRILITAGFDDWARGTGLTLEDHFTFHFYISDAHCTGGGCLPSSVLPNLSPWGQDNFFLGDYSKWYSICLGFTPSNGATNTGRLRYWINGVAISDYNNIQTQDSSSPYVDQFGVLPTQAQPAYDAPAHRVLLDNFMFASTQQEVIDAGLMEDPEEGAGAAYSLECSPGRYTY